VSEVTVSIEQYDEARQEISRLRAELAALTTGVGTEDQPTYSAAYVDRPRAELAQMRRDWEREALLLSGTLAELGVAEAAIARVRGLCQNADYHDSDDGLARCLDVTEVLRALDGEA
jgi:hypothetical protein